MKPGIDQEGVRWFRTDSTPEGRELIRLRKRHERHRLYQAIAFALICTAVLLWLR